MTTPPRIYALARAVEYVAARRVPGAFVECGVWRGGSMMAIALTLLRLGVTDRELYLFDTFAGMTPPGDEDVKHTGERAADMLARSSRDSHDWALASLDDVKSRRARRRLPRPSGSTSWRARSRRRSRRARPTRSRCCGSTRTGTRRRSTRSSTSTRSLATGGVVIVDDYAYWQGARQAVDEYIREHDLPLLLNRIDYTARIAIKT